jgi:ribosomal protein L11 methylase PrmA
VNLVTENKLQRRVAGYHNVRLDGVGDILTRARDASVFDIGCSLGQVSHDFVLNGANKVHGCDIDPLCISVAKHWFHNFRAIESKFEVVDLAQGPSALDGFDKYDIVVMLATYHKLRRVMDEKLLSALMDNIADRTLKYFVWRGTSEKAHENEYEINLLDKNFTGKLKRIHTSTLSLQLGVAAIWARR